jgi:hypothetical protein
MVQRAQGLTRRNLMSAIALAAVITGSASTITAEDAVADSPELVWDVEEQNIAIVIDPVTDRPVATGLARIASRFSGGLFHGGAAKRS